MSSGPKTCTVFALAGAMAIGIARGATEQQQILHVVFDGKGTSQELFTTNPDTYTAQEEWHASWDVTIPNIAVGFPAGANMGPALPGTWVTGVTSVKRASGNGNCQGSPVINAQHGGVAPGTPQSPYIYFTNETAEMVVSMSVDVFGGFDYRLCDGLWLPAVGTYDPPDPAPAMAMFSIDLNDWLGQNKTMTIPVKGDYTTVAGAADTGEVHWSGTITISTKSCSCMACQTTLSGSKARAAADTSQGGCQVVVNDIRFADEPLRVVRDRLSADGPDQVISDVAPPCNIPAPIDAHYVSCSTPSNPDKSWPVTALRGSTLVIDQVTFRRTNTGDNTTIKGELLGVAEDGNGVEVIRYLQDDFTMNPGQLSVTLNNLTPIGTLDEARFIPRFQIHWTINQPDGTTIDAGTSIHPLFVMLGPRVLPALFPQVEEKPYLTLLYNAALFTDGDSDPQTFRDDLWIPFSNRDSLERADLTVASGAITPGVALQFWPPHWNLLNWLNGNYGPKPGAVIDALLHDGVATGGGWATMWAGMLRLEGVNAKEISVDDSRGWSGYIYSPNGKPAQYFMVGKWESNDIIVLDGVFTNDYPYITGIVFSGPSTIQNPNTIIFDSATGQNNTTPFALWETSLPGFLSRTANYFLVQTDDGSLWDPSYGLGPFHDLHAWALTAINGWAQIVDKSGNRVDDPTRCRALGVCYFEAHVGLIN